MGYKMKGSPIKRGSIQGTSGHRSALKAHEAGHKKNKEDYLKEGFSQREADQMMKTGATTGEQKPKSKGKFITKDGKKYWQAPDGTLHTGQVSDYETEKKSPAKQSVYDTMAGFRGRDAELRKKKKKVGLKDPNLEKLRQRGEESLQKFDESGRLIKKPAKKSPPSKPIPLPSPSDKKPISARKRRKIELREAKRAGKEKRRQQRHEKRIARATRDIRSVRKSKEGSPAKQKVDPDAPGTPGQPGYEPPVKRSDLDKKGKAIWDAHRAKGFDIKSKKKPSKFANLTTARYGEYSYDPEVVATRKSEGTIAQQHQRRLKKKK